MAALAYVGVGTAYNTGSSTVHSTVARSFTTGNHICVFIRWESTNPATITLADTAGNTYTALTKSFATAVGGRWFYCLNATGHASNVITATFSTAQSYVHIYATELSGVAASVSEQLYTTAASVLETSASTGNVGPLVYGSESIVLLGSAHYQGDPSCVFTGGPSLTFTKLTGVGNYGHVAYAADAVGTAGAYGTVTGANGYRVFIAIAVASGNAPPSINTTARTTQLSAEVQRTNSDPVAKLTQLSVETARLNTGNTARVTQLSEEILRINTGNLARISQLSVEVLRPNLPNLSNIAHKRIVFVF